MVNEREVDSGDVPGASSVRRRRKVKLQMLLGVLILLSGIVIGAGEYGDFATRADQLAEPSSTQNYRRGDCEANRRFL